MQRHKMPLTKVVILNVKVKTPPQLPKRPLVGRRPPLGITDVVDKPRLFKCNKCDNTFSGPKEKKDHNSKVHPKIENKEKKVYECQVEGCYKKYTTRNGLKYHKRTQH
jgi:hypothetical protein